MPYVLSPNRLELFKECPRCFWLLMRKGIKRPAGKFSSLPSGMDAVLKNHFDSYMERGELPPELVKEGIEAKLFEDMELLREWRNGRKGIRWSDERGNVLMGAVDNILVKGNKLIVLDFKTRGFQLKENTANFYQTQMDVYNFLLRKNGYETEDYGYLLFYYPVRVGENGVIFETKLVKVEVSVENAERIFREAIKVLEGDIPEPSKDCEYCKWRENNFE